MKRTPRVRRLKRKVRIRKKVHGTPTVPRFSVFRSLNHVYGQLIDDEGSVTLVGLSSCSNDVSSFDGDVSEDLTGKQSRSWIVGNLIAQKAGVLGIKKVIFDRNGYKFHGRIAAIADGARAGGLDF